VIAVALLVFGLALPPLSARPLQRPGHAASVSSPVVAVFNKLLLILGIKGRDEAGGTQGGQPQGLTLPIAAPPADDARSTLDPNGHC